VIDNIPVFGGGEHYLEFLELRRLSELTVRLMFQNLLGVIGNILVTHTRYKRSDDSHFKAFICAALKYVTFLSIVMNWCSSIHFVIIHIYVYMFLATVLLVAGNLMQLCIFGVLQPS
jgi:hypothetical protein